eukprot:scaffold17242_cov126-Isochrysis_galbana.AAC.8
MTEPGFSRGRAAGPGPDWTRRRQVVWGRPGGPSLVSSAGDVPRGTSGVISTAQSLRRSHTIEERYDRILYALTRHSHSVIRPSPYLRHGHTLTLDSGWGWHEVYSEA